MSKTFYEEIVKVTENAEAQLRTEREQKTAELLAEMKSQITAQAKAGNREVRFSFPNSTYGIDLCAQTFEEQGFGIEITRDRTPNGKTIILVTW